MRESEIEAYLVKRVRALGGECRKVQWTGRRGAPDRFVMLPDRPAFWVELKATGEKCSPAQKREHARMGELGQRVEVIDSPEEVDWMLG